MHESVPSERRMGISGLSNLPSLRSRVILSFYFHGLEMKALWLRHDIFVTLLRAINCRHEGFGTNGVEKESKKEAGSNKQQRTLFLAGSDYRPVCMALGCT